jgi:hypothetical protein
VTHHPGQRERGRGVDQAKAKDHEDVFDHVVVDGDNNDQAQRADTAGGGEQVGTLVETVCKHAERQYEDERRAVERNRVVLADDTAP